jgi:hypothetical protein
LLNSKNQILAFALNKPGSVRARLVLFFIFFASISSCNLKLNNTEDESIKGKKIAKVYERDVYDTDIFSLNKKDSAIIANNYLEDLAIKEALFLKAKESGLVNEESIEIQTERFRKSLFSAQFENEFVKQKLDTNVKEDELKQYFQKNESQMLLHSTIFKGYYVILPINSNKVVRLKELMLSEKTIDLQELKNFCVRYSSAYSIDIKEWVEMPIQISRIYSFTHEGVSNAIKHNQLLTFEKDDNLYLIRLIDFKFANQPSPYSYIENELKQLLLNERKAEIIAQLKAQLLSESKENNKIEIY